MNRRDAMNNVIEIQCPKCGCKAEIDLPRFDFANKLRIRTLDEVRVEMLKTLTQNGLNIEQIAKKMGVSQRSVYRWLSEKRT